MKQEQEKRKAKMEKEIEKKKQEEDEQKKEKFEKKKQHIIEKIQSRRQNIENSKSMMKKETKKIVRKSPLHAKLAEKFEESYIIPELQKRKEALSKIRNLHQPIRLTNIREHSENKKRLLEEKLKEYFGKRSEYASAATSNPDKYNSYFWKVVEQRERQENAKLKEEHLEARGRHQKSLDYAKNVKELYKPTISKKKKLEMELIKKNLEDPHSFVRARRGVSSVKENHNRSMISPTSKELSTEVSSPQRSKRRLAKPKPLDDKRYSYHPVPHDKHKFVKHDYLTLDRLSKVTN